MHITTTKRGRNHFMQDPNLLAKSQTKKAKCGKATKIKFLWSLIDQTAKRFKTAKILQSLHN